MVSQKVRADRSCGKEAANISLRINDLAFANGLKSSHILFCSIFASASTLKALNKIFPQGHLQSVNFRHDHCRA